MSVDFHHALVVISRRFEANRLTAGTSAEF